MIGTEKGGRSDWLAKWESPQGTMLLNAVYESCQDGTPNVVTLMDARRYLRFDPVSRTVIYALRLSSGRLLSFELPLKNVLPHVIIFTWDYEKGGTLFVDGAMQDKTTELARH
jgi:hypothetical protein